METIFQGVKTTENSELSKKIIQQLNSLAAVTKYEKSFVKSGCRIFKYANCSFVMDKQVEAKQMTN